MKDWGNPSDKNLGFSASGMVRFWSKGVEFNSQLNAGFGWWRLWFVGLKNLLIPRFPNGPASKGKESAPRNFVVRRGCGNFTSFSKPDMKRNVYSR